MVKPKYTSDINRLTQLKVEEKKELTETTNQYPLLANDYYLNLIDWKDPKDPIRRIVVPQKKEHELWDWGQLDPSNENRFLVAPGLQHKYRQTALMLVTDRCDSLCRYCFRKRLFTEEDTRNDINKDYRPAVEYINGHEEINSVLLTGGDPLVLPTTKLTEILSALDQIKHVQTIRIGSKIPAFNPYRILDDPTLPQLFARFSKPERRLFLMTHFTHPRELTSQAKIAISLIIKAGGIVCNQSPLIRGVNDDSDVLAKLFRNLMACGITPYYLFQCRPTKGNLTFTVPIERGADLFYTAQRKCTGLASRVRYCMSHSKGKIEILGKHGGQMLMRFHRTPDATNHGRIMSFPTQPEAYWFEDYLKASNSGLPTWPNRQEKNDKQFRAAGS